MQYKCATQQCTIEKQMPVPKKNPYVNAYTPGRQQLTKTAIKAGLKKYMRYCGRSLMF